MYRKSKFFVIILSLIFVCPLIPFVYSTDEPPLEEGTFNASIVNLEAPDYVYTWASFAVEFTVSYEFSISTEMFLGIFDVETETWITTEPDTLVGAGTKTYSFELTAPEEETMWALGANIQYVLEGDWTSNEEGSAPGFDILVVEEEDGDARELALFEGWNLISLPLTPVDPSNGVVLADILDDVNSVWTFDGEAKTWSSYSPGAPSNLVEMVDDQGYWIKMTEDATLTLRGEYVYTGELALFEGWNFIGLPLTPEDPSIEVVLADILDNVIFVWAFDGETKTWSVYSPGAPSDLTEIVEGRGYWIKMKADANLTIYGVRVRVAILVDADIALEIQENLNQYVVDIETIYSDTRLQTYSGNWQSPEEVRSFIQDLYYNNSGISGVILVGELPYVLWEYFPGDIGPLPYYYEDLDGIFQDQNEDGILDYHIEDNQKPEIWVSWMRPHSDNMAQSINGYLQKSHLYYFGNISYQDKALVAIDPDWIIYTQEVRQPLLQIYQENDITIMNGTAGISPQEYLDEYTKQYEFTSVWSHADHDYHEFARGDLLATTIKSLDNGSKIILIWGCHAGDFHKSPYNGDILASAYVFNNVGMASIAATRELGIENYWIVIDGLAEGDTIGEAFLKWISYAYNHFIIENQYPDEEFNKFMWGFILTGDPFVQLNKFQQLLN